MGEGGEEGMGLPAWVYTKCSGKGYVGKLYNQVSFFFFFFCLHWILVAACEI